MTTPPRWASAARSSTLANLADNLRFSNPWPPLRSEVAQEATGQPKYSRMRVCAHTWEGHMRACAHTWVSQVCACVCTHAGGPHACVCTHVGITGVCVCVHTRVRATCVREGPAWIPDFSDFRKLSSVGSARRRLARAQLCLLWSYGRRPSAVAWSAPGSVAGLAKLHFLRSGGQGLEKRSQNGSLGVQWRKEARSSAGRTGVSVQE